MNVFVAIILFNVKLDCGANKVPTALFNVSPAKNIMAIGLVLDDQHKKISKKSKKKQKMNVIMNKRRKRKK